MASSYERPFYDAESKGKGVNTNGSCPLYGQGPENTMHALFNCDDSKLFGIFGLEDLLSWMVGLWTLLMWLSM